MFASFKDIVRYCFLLPKFCDSMIIRGKSNSLTKKFKKYLLERHSQYLFRHYCSDKVALLSF